MVIRRLFFLAFIASLSPWVAAFCSSPAPQIHAKAAIVMELGSKKIIYQKNAHQTYCPASVTKLPTALYALKKGTCHFSSIATADRDTVGSITKKFSIDNKYKYPSHWLVLGGTHIQIDIGEELRFQDLIYGMLLVSANDASNVVAKHVCGSVPVFMQELNAYLKTLGCKNTQFKNPHGMYYPKQLTTAYDMALITCEAVKEPHLLKILNTQTYQIPATNKKDVRIIHNENKLLSKKSVYYYPYAIGGKNGFDDNARHTMVAAAKKGEKTLVVVLLQCPSKSKKYEDTIKLFEHGFKSLN